MFAKTAFPSTQTLTQTNASCSKGEEKSLKSSPTPRQPGMGATLGVRGELSHPAQASPPGVAGAEGTLSLETEAR